MAQALKRFGLVAGVLAAGLVLASPAVAQPRFSIGVYGRHGGFHFDTGGHYRYGHPYHGWHSYGRYGHRFYPAHERYYHYRYDARPRFQRHYHYDYGHCW